MLVGCCCCTQQAGLSMCCSISTPASTAVILVCMFLIHCGVESQHSCSGQALASLLLLTAAVYLILSSSSSPSPGADHYLP